MRRERRQQLQLAHVRLSGRPSTSAACSSGLISSRSAGGGATLPFSPDIIVDDVGVPRRGGYLAVKQL